VCRPGGNNEVCFESLEKALAEHPETYRHLDLIAFGFPCQDISNANPKGKGIEGEKSGLFFEAMRIVKLLMPQWILIENVPRLLSIHGGRDFGIVLQTLAESGYGYCWNILDSQWFAVPQRRKRLFIAGRFGKVCPIQILSEPKGRCGDIKAVRKIRQRGLCLSTRSGNRYDPKAETFIASTIQATDYKKVQHRQFGNEGNLIAQAVKASAHGAPTLLFGDTLIANTVTADKRGTDFRPDKQNILAEANPVRKREIAGPAGGMDSARGVIIGNGITVPVMEWIGRRIRELAYGEMSK